MDVVGGPLRDAVRTAAPAGTTTLVGGTSAVFADVARTINRDMRLILPVAAALILLILLVTLRSAVAPLYLLAAVVLEFAATLGASVLAFQMLGGQAGLAFTLPLVMFLFVVALGTDYNILMTARLREEMLAGRSVPQAVAEAVRHVAPAVGAAGLVLATSFGTLMLEAGQDSRQEGFAMASGSCSPRWSSPRSSCRRSPRSSAGGRGGPAGSPASKRRRHAPRSTRPSPRTSRPERTARKGRRARRGAPSASATARAVQGTAARAHRRRQPDHRIRDRMRRCTA